MRVFLRVSLPSPSLLSVIFLWGIALGLSYHQWLDPLWHDECYTLAHFATGRVRDALLDYHAPNNHQLFSLVLGIFRSFLTPEQAVDAKILRIIPLFFFLAAIGLLYGLVRAYAGEWEAILASLCFLTSHAVINYALELRGYSASWVPALLAWWGLMRMREGKGGVVLYTLASFLAQGLLPTNLLVFSGLIVWFVMEEILDHGRSILLPHIFHWLLLALLPVGMTALFLLPVWDQLQESIQGGASMEKSVVWWHMPWSFFRDFAWLLPLIVVGALAFQYSEGGEIREIKKISFRPLLLCGIMVIVPLGLALAMPRTPNDRVFVTLAPLLYLGLGTFLARFFLRLRYARAWLMGSVLGLVGFGIVREATDAGYAKRHGAAAHIHDLYDQTFQHDYRIDETMATIQRIQPPALIVVGSCDPYGFLWHIKHRYPKVNKQYAVIAALLFPDLPATLEYTRQLATNQPLFIVAGNQSEADKLAQQIRPHTSCTANLIGDHGFFRVYAVDALGEPPR